jgi:tRNA modification GTPase
VFSTSDTIVAIATPPGRGGLGIVRLSGYRAHAIASRLIARERPLTPRHATLALVKADAAGADAVQDRPRAIDQVVVTYFPAPASYTGDDVVELSAHGSPIVLRHIVAAAVGAGARVAEPGEFTLRAYLNGRIDLPQAEAVADLIDAVTPLQARAAFDQLQGTLTQAIGDIDRQLLDLIARLEASIDFPDEGYHFIEPGELASSIDRVAGCMATLLNDAKRGRLLREGLQVAIVGRPNAGKSSLFNALVGTSRAIVAAAPGTTRDLITETIDLHGLRVTLVDTAGLRESQDPIESEGVARTTRAAAVADLVLVVADRSEPLGSADTDRWSLQDVDNKCLIVASKGDLEPAWTRTDCVVVSARTGFGMEELRKRMVDVLDVDPKAERPEVTNVRHVALVERAHAAMCRARAAVDSEGRSLSEEFVLADLQDASAAIEEITGKRTPDDVLAHIFARFCIGK